MIFRQLFDEETWTYTYILGDEQTREAVIIDSVKERVDRDMKMLDELGLKLKFALETHVHADHVTGAGLLRQRTGAKTVVSKFGGATCPDVLVDDGDTINFGHYALEVRSTPGHTDGDITYVLSDQTMAFTGDTLFIRGCGRTDFQQGDPNKMYDSVYEKIFTLPDNCLVYPGHDYNGRTVSTVAEEKAYNPRLGHGKTRDDFAQIMNNLKLPRPKKIDVAVPANLHCGLSEGEVVQGTAPADDWAPVYRTATGIPEVTPDWVAESGAKYRMVDVRETHEYAGELGHIAGAELVPLDTVQHAAQTWDLTQPVVVICRSGGRSGRAALLLEQMGFHKVASMAGGMLLWNEKKLPVARTAA